MWKRSLWRRPCANLSSASIAPAARRSQDATLGVRPISCKTWLLHKPCCLYHELICCGIVAMIAGLVSFAVYLCVCVCEYIYIHIYRCARICLPSQTLLTWLVYVCMYVFHICTDIYRCVCDQNYTHIKVRGYTYAYTYLYTFICLPKHTCIYKYMYICIYLYRYLPTYLTTFLPTSLHACAYT